MLTRTVAEGGMAGEKTAVESPAAESLNRKSRLTRLAWMKASPMFTAAIGQTGRSVEAVAARQHTAHGYPDEIAIQAPAVSLETRLPHYGNFRTSSVVADILIWTMSHVAGESAGASSG